MDAYRFITSTCWNSPIAVNRRLEQQVPAVPSPDKIHEVLEAARMRDEAAQPAEELMIELGAAQPAGTYR